MHLFFIDVDATGIDPMKDRIIQICAMDLENGEKYTEIVGQIGLVSTALSQRLDISTAALSKAKRFGEVMASLFDWIDQKCPNDDTIYLVSHNGHRFTFPILTKEMRRYKIAIHKTFILLDSLYTLRQFGITSLDFQTNCRQRMDMFLDIFKNKTGHEMNDKEGIKILRQDNDKQITEDPQPTFETKFLRIN